MNNDITPATALDPTRSESVCQPFLLHVIGYPSSGTTLLRDILDVHPEIRITGEFPLLPSLLSLRDIAVSRANFAWIKAKFLLADVYENLANTTLTYDDLEARFGAVGTFRLEHVYVGLLDAGRYLYYGNKTPQYTEAMGALLELFPTTKVICIVRDVRDVALSFKRKWNKCMLLAADKWAVRMQLGLRHLDALPEDQRLIVRYEDLLQYPERLVREICGFLDVPASERMLHHMQHQRLQFAGKKNANSEFDTNNIGKWRTALTRAQIRRIEEVSLNMMKRFGYAPQFARHSIPLGPSARMLMEAKDAVAALTVGNRYRTAQSLTDRIDAIGITVKRRLFVRRG